MSKYLKPIQCEYFGDSIEEIKKRNFYLTEEFLKWMQKNGLSTKTQNQHLVYILMFLNDYLLYYGDCENGCCNVEAGVDNIDDFFGNFFIRKVLNSNEKRLKEATRAIKKFYKFLYEKGLIKKSDYQKVLDTIKNNLSRWLVKMSQYNDPDLDAFELDWIDVYIRE